MAIITLSREMGSLGKDIALTMEKELNLNYLDKESLELMLTDYGITEAEVEKYDEKKPSFWTIFFSERNRYLHFLKTAVYSFARKGPCVIVGRGGQVLFQNVPGVLKVRIIAPPEQRLERVKERFGCSDRQAKQIIEHSDNDRSGFHKIFFNIPWERLNLYDLVINTGLLSVAAAAALIKGAFHEIRKAPLEEELKLKDLCLAQEVITRILYTEKLSIRLLEVISTDGVVLLKGNADTQAIIAGCKQMVEEMPGVKGAISELYFEPQYVGGIHNAI